jgi:glucosamine 6-phosphate synthetase-like amidotransferase/phosphosugar isomerase protein
MIDQQQRNVKNLNPQSTARHQPKPRDNMSKSKQTEEAKKDVYLAQMSTCYFAAMLQRPFYHTIATVKVPQCSAVEICTQP